MSETTDWIEWSGGECPVDGDVDVTLRDGSRDTEGWPARSYGWKHVNLGQDIVAYRIHKES